MSEQSTNYVSEGGCAEVVGNRAQIRNIRNASDLIPGCQYRMTGYVRGCLTAGIVEEIVLTATAVNEFSMDVDVNTTLDNTAWRGKFDIDLNRITSLEDNRGNRVYGATGVEVDRFPWTDTGVRENIVDNADLLIDCTTAITLTNNRFENDSATDLRGCTGFMTNSTVESDAQLTLTNRTNVRVTGSVFQSRSRIIGANGDNLYLYYHTHSSEAYWIFTGRSDVRSYYSTFDSTARVYGNNANVTRQWFYYSKIGSYAHVRILSGIFQMYYSSMSSYAEYRQEAGAGTGLIYGADWTSRAYIRNYVTGTFRSQYDSIDSTGRMTVRGATVNTYYNTISSYAQKLINGATIVYASVAQSFARATYTGGTHYRNNFDTYSRITMPFNTRNVYGKGSWAQTLTAANSNKGRDYFNNNLV